MEFGNDECGHGSLLRRCKFEASKRFPQNPTFYFNLKQFFFIIIIQTQEKVIAVDWSKANSEIVCCLGIDGVLVVWNVARNITQQISLGKLTGTCLSSCPHNSDLVAIGTKSGLVYVIDIRGVGKIIYKLRGHDAEISCLSWCPIATNIATGTDSKDLLLASGAKDR